MSTHSLKKRYSEYAFVGSRGRSAWAYRVVHEDNALYLAFLVEISDYRSTLVQDYGRSSIRTRTPHHRPLFEPLRAPARAVRRHDVLLEPVAPVRLLETGMSREALYAALPESDRVSCRSCSGYSLFCCRRRSRWTIYSLRADRPLTTIPRNRLKPHPQPARQIQRKELLPDRLRI